MITFDRVKVWRSWPSHREVPKGFFVVKGAWNAFEVHFRKGNLSDSQLAILVNASDARVTALALAIHAGKPISVIGGEVILPQGER